MTSDVDDVQNLNFLQVHANLKKRNLIDAFVCRNNVQFHLILLFLTSIKTTWLLYQRTIYNGMQ